MKNLSLSIELSSFAIEATACPMAYDELLYRVEAILRQHKEFLGKLTGSSEQQKSLGDGLRLSEHQFDYEQHSVQVELANVMPRGDWQVQGIRLV